MRQFLLTLLEQMVNSAIVAGIAALSMLAGQQAVDGRSVAVAFGLAFLIEMRKYRLNRRA